MRRLLLILLSAELLIAILLGQGGFLRRHDFDRAFFAWHQSPTPDNRMELDRQRRLNEWYRWGFSAVAFGGMAMVTLLGVYVFHRRHPGKRNIQG